LTLSSIHDELAHSNTTITSSDSDADRGKSDAKVTQSGQIACEALRNQRSGQCSATRGAVYADRAACEQHIASAHFLKYKKGMSTWSSRSS
jgi:hypothetical protein